MPPSTIRESTASYEDWMRTHTNVVQADLDYKHEQMVQGLFTFFRATFYRWAEIWPEICQGEATAPHVLAVGDLHVENFGTWRDFEGRLVWGINDFDEAHRLPYTIDLIRLATSAKLAVKPTRLSLTLTEACEAILEGYSDGLRAGGRPFVLEEDHHWLRRVATSDLRDPVLFWQKMDALPVSRGRSEAAVRRVLTSALPRGHINFRLLRRRAGEGSLGRQRVVGDSTWLGARLAREAKAVLPSAWLWAHPVAGRPSIYYRTIVDRAVRCPDPSISLDSNWLVRRLAPDCSLIELTSLPLRNNDERLLHAMGWETANVHLGSAGMASSVRADLKARPPDWLRLASKAMIRATQQDWLAWQQAMPVARSAPAGRSTPARRRRQLG